MSEDTKLTRCDVCNEMIVPDKAVYDKGMAYPEIAKEKHEDNTVSICEDCNQKLEARDIPNSEPVV